MKDTVLIESPTLRQELIQSGAYEVLNKVKDIAFIDRYGAVTVHQLANYYEVEENSINKLTSRHWDEFEEDGIFKLTGDELKEFKAEVRDKLSPTLYDKIKFSPSLRLFPKRSVLRIGMLLRDSRIAKKIRNYLLNIEEGASESLKKWSLIREAGKMVRKDFTDAIRESGENERMHGYAYVNYTDLVYRTVFGKSGKKMYEERGLESRDNLRNALSGQELQAVKDVENVIIGLLKLDYEYSEVKEQLNKRYDGVLFNQAS